ncbi:MAG TPA: serine/threonine-protein kinase [Bryobacteraceae bacterium]
MPLLRPEDSHDGPSPLRRFGPYEILRKLGRSMTDVYLARDTRNSRTTVLKIVEESNDPYTQQVLVAERRGAAIQKQLRDFDPRFVEIFEYGQMENAFYVAMEYVEGQSVADNIRETGRIEPETAARIALEICSQLEKLHSHQAEIDGRRRAIVHGDIKPSNVQLTSNGQVRLLDFGIAKVISLTRNLTHHDLGSPNYCSPERLASARVDQYSDLWAVGVSLYEMVSGSLPYQAESTRKLENVIRSKRPPRPIPADCPPRLATIVRKSLASDIKRRYTTASAFAADLECFLNGRPTIAECELKNAETNPTVESVRVIDRSSPASQVGMKNAPDVLWQTLLRVRVPVRIGRKGAGWIVAAVCGSLVLGSSVSFYERRWSEAAPLRTHTSLANLGNSEIAADWKLYQRLQARDRWMGRLSPAYLAARNLEPAYVAEGDRIIDNYRKSQDSKTEHFDWLRAQNALEHAAELDPDTPSVQGKLALVRGYINLNQASTGAQTNVPQHVKDLVTSSWKAFDQAGTLLPNAPDPHLGLARLYVYSYRELDKAIEEWDKAEQRHYKLQPRELEQEADGFRLRAKKEKDSPDPHDHAAAEEDLRHSRELFESIKDYDDVPQYLKLIAQDELALNPPAPPAHLPAPTHRAISAKAAKAARQKRTQAWQSPKAGKRRKS